MQYAGSMEHSHYYPLMGKEDEFLSAWKKGAQMIAKSMGAYDIGIYWDKNLSAFIAVQHWNDEESFQEYSTSEALRAWSEEVSKISSKPSVRHLLQIVEEAA